MRNSCKGFERCVYTSSVALNESNTYAKIIPILDIIFKVKEGCDIGSCFDRIWS